jgi:alpha-ribazole phosphatase
MTSIYLVRHGETELNRKGCYYGWTDCELSGVGEKQAMMLKNALKEVNFDVVISSDLKRAKDTAVIVKGEREIKILKDERLRELNFGEWEGRHYTVISKQYLKDWEAWIKDWQNTVLPKGESFTDMYARVRQCIDEILEKYKDKDILMVSHQGVLRIVMTYILGISAEKIWSFSFLQGKYSVLGLENNNWVVKGLNA